MAKKYTRKEIVAMCETASLNMSSFYQQNFVNYVGTVKGENSYYTEIIAEWLLENLDKFDKIQEIQRKSSYNLHHDGSYDRITNRTEELRAKDLFNLKTIYTGIGRIIDYQTPLKNTQSDNAGKIDLLSINDDENKVFILELKRDDSHETMLRCVLEAFTYLKIVSKDKLFSSFDIPADYQLKAAPLVYQNSKPYTEYTDKERKCLHELMQELKIEPFILKEFRTFEVTKP